MISFAFLTALHSIFSFQYPGRLEKCIDFSFCDSHRGLFVEVYGCNHELIPPRTIGLHLTLQKLREGRLECEQFNFHV